MDAVAAAAAQREWVFAGDSVEKNNALAEQMKEVRALAQERISELTGTTEEQTPKLEVLKAAGEVVARARYAYSAELDRAHTLLRLNKQRFQFKPPRTRKPRWLVHVVPKFRVWPEPKEIYFKVEGDPNAGHRCIEAKWVDKYHLSVDYDKTHLVLDLTTFNVDVQTK